MTLPPLIFTPLFLDLPSGISYEMIPSLDPAALAMPPDNDWSSSSDWSSRPSTPAQGLPFTEPLQVSTYAYLSQMQLVPSSGPSSQNTYGFSAPGTSDSRPSSPETPKRKDRIPRPPNAFMLYRSHLLKTGRIPREVEQRQQNISRVAGECWNMLTKEEKAVWHAEAKKAMELHKIRHPGWKFSPERRSARRKPFDLDGAPVDGKEHIRRIREQCVGIIGPAVSPPRPRKPRSRRGAEAREQTASLPPSLHPSPSTTPVSHLISSAPPSLTGSPASHVLPITAFNSGPDYMLAMPHPDFFQQEFLARYPVSAPQSHVPLPTTALDDDAVCPLSLFLSISRPDFVSCVDP